MSNVYTRKAKYATSSPRCAKARNRCHSVSRLDSSMQWRRPILSTYCGSSPASARYAVRDFFAISALILALSPPQQKTFICGGRIPTTMTNCRITRKRIPGAR